MSGSSGKGPGRNICVGRENEFSSEVGTEEAVPALRGGPRGVEGRPGRAASTPRTPPPGRRRLPGWPFMPRRRERSLARFPSFMSGPGLAASFLGQSRPGQVPRGTSAARWPTRVGLVCPLPPVTTYPHWLLTLSIYTRRLSAAAQSDAGDPGVGVAGAQGRYLHPCGPLDVSRSPIHSAGFQAIKLPSEKRADTRVVPSFKHLACFYIGSL